MANSFNQSRSFPGWLIVVMVVGLLAAAIFYFFKPFGTGERTRAAPTPSAQVEQRPKTTVTRATRAAASEPPLPPPPPAVNPDTQRLVALVKRRVPARNGGGSLARLIGASGIVYEVYYTGDALPPERRSIMIRDLPVHGDAHDPLSITNRRSMAVWDRGLDGAVDNGTNGSPFSALPEERRTRFQRKIEGLQDAIGLENATAFQARYEQMRTDILAGPPR